MCVCVWEGGGGSVYVYYVCVCVGGKRAVYNSLSSPDRILRCVCVCMYVLLLLLLLVVVVVFLYVLNNYFSLYPAAHTHTKKKKKKLIRNASSCRVLCNNSLHSDLMLAASLSSRIREVSDAKAPITY